MQNSERIKGRRIYLQHIMDHYKNPRNTEVIKEPSTSAHEENVLCGDSTDVQLQIKSGKILKGAFQTKGCAISIAAGSLLSKELEGLTIGELEAIDKQKMLDILGVDVNPARTKCAMLCLDAAKKAVKNLNNLNADTRKEPDLK